ncbi:MAG: DNA topoisomerase [Candidatus Saccharibacteria bacterium]|nr:DNA topoisomerase [Candidatus Saccharibacteria bacterium]
MAKNLVIVESPAKAHTIEKYLGSDFKVLASVGHIRKDTKVDKSTFEVTYEIDPDHKSIINELKKEATKADKIWLATDEDREGESISWHLCEVLKLPKNTARITFHEITKPALENAIKNPRTVDMDMVSSQQARQTLDMLVGFDLSDIVRRKVPGAISAGRVQSPALRLIVEREKDIEKFDSKYNFKVTGNFAKDGGAVQKVPSNTGTTFVAKGEVVIFDGFLRVYGKSKDLELPKVTRGDLLKLTEMVAKQTYAKPPARYTEGSLVKKLEELGIGRPSTYASIMTAIQARKYVEKGESEGQERDVVELLVEPSAKKSSSFTAALEGEQPQDEKAAQELLGKLSEADFVVTEVEETEGSKANPVPFTTAALQIEANAKLGFSSRTTMSAAQGLYQAGLITYHRTDSLNLSSQAVGAISKYIEETFGKNYLKVRHFKTKDASAQEAHEAIRPTDVFRTAAGKNDYEKRLYQLIWARTVATQMANAKVAKTTIRIAATNESADGAKPVKRTIVREKFGANKGKLIPTPIGELVSEFLTDNFKNIVDYKFTANIEKDLDLVAEAKLERVKMLKDFYGPFRDTVLTANGVERYNNARLLGHHPETGQPIYAKVGKTGGFIQLGDNSSKGAGKGADKPRFAPLPKRKSVKTVTLEQALKQLELPALPRSLGKASDGAELIAANGPFGPYLKGGKYNIPIKDYDPYTITMEEALPLYQAKVDSIIADWGEIMIINGAYGPYIKGPGRRNNAKIPKETDPKSITETVAREMLANKPKTTRRGVRGGRKKTTKARKTTTKKTARK